MAPGTPVSGVEETCWGWVFIQGMLVYWAGYELLGFTSYFHRFIYTSSFALQFKTINERINYILTRGTQEWFTTTLSTTQGLAICWGKRPFIKKGDCSSREGETVCQGKEEAICWGKRCLSRDVHWGRRPCIEGGRQPFIKGRRLCIKGGKRLFVEGGWRLFVEGGDCLLREGPCPSSSREKAVCQERRLFVKGGGQPSIEGGRRL